MSRALLPRPKRYKLQYLDGEDWIGIVLRRGISGGFETCRVKVTCPIPTRQASWSPLQLLGAGRGVYLRNTPRYDDGRRQGGLGACRTARSIALWTCRLPEKVSRDLFTPDSCSEPESTSGSVSALTLGAGVSMDDVISFARQHAAPSAAGSAGSLGPSGIAPDGQVRTANRCTSKDPFRTLGEPETPLTVAFISFTATSKNQLPFVELPAENTLERQGGSSVAQTHASYFEYYTMYYINGSFANSAPVSTATFVTRIVHEAIFRNARARPQGRGWRA
ncbi:hypothetical protein EKO27_g11275 [Xylaria grammica]|uniref:Uncharacterized protein n=1 Tax=Xylaria grammica TaxID=363999 RepID=A0A439CP09_9PEZI|nr:hypothetical protein EKO27_g11275 [Xylaria grammica]